MKTLYKKLKVVFPGSEHNGRNIDILVQNNKIVDIGSNLNSEAEKTVITKGLLLMPTLVDMQCSVGEPGNEHKETLESAAKAAKSGGFGTIVTLPTTSPVVDNKAQLHYISQKSNKLPVQILSYGSITKGAKGIELSEMYDMKQHGALAFSDGKRPIEDASMMKRALEYAKAFDGIVCSFPYEERLSPGAMAHESVGNTSLGIKCAPALSEQMMLSRDLSLLEYTHSRLHVSTLSSSESLKLTKEAKKRKLSVTVGVALPNLLFTDEELQTFDTNYKTIPFLREKSDKDALIKAASTGEIDVIVTDHSPENVEGKDREFDHAEYGMTMLETALSLINMHLVSALNWDAIVTLMAINPRRILGLPAPSLEKGAEFDFIVFDPNTEWIYNKTTCLSLSQNSPVFGETLKGRVIS